jgi:hypothetical protein
VGLYLGFNVWNGIDRFRSPSDFNLVNYLGIKEALDRAAPAGARTGVFQAGAVGYFSEREVINLDGVVNGAALRAMKERRMLSYLRETGIEYVADYGVILDKLFFPALEPGGQRALVPLSPASAKVQVYRVQHLH